jgi:uncharacterized membrane protein (DUF106 family)
VLWVPLIAWAAAIMVAAVVLGACGYELAWKRRRLLADLESLQQLRQALAELQSDLSAAQQRATQLTGR